jgi:hypothetical protein
MRFKVGQMFRTVTVAAMACAVGAAAVHAQKPGQTASEFYLAYSAAMAKAKTIDELLPYMSKQRVDQVKGTPADERAMMFDMVKEMGAKNVKVVKETPSAAGATLETTGTDGAGGAMKGTITLVKEAGAWKIDKESWSNK